MTRTEGHILLLDIYFQMSAIIETKGSPDEQATNQLLLRLLIFNLYNSW